MRVNLLILKFGILGDGVATDEDICLIHLGPVGDLTLAKVEPLVANIIKKGRQENFSSLPIPRHFLILQECCIFILIFDLNVNDVSSLKSPLDLRISWQVHHTYLSVTETGRSKLGRIIELLHDLLQLSI